MEFVAARTSASCAVPLSATFPARKAYAICSQSISTNATQVFSSGRIARYGEAHRRTHALRACAGKQTYSSFEDLLENSTVAVLVDFYATWCGPCQYMVPILNDVGAAMKDDLKVIKIDSEKYPNLASKYDVQALPTMILFKAGLPVERFEGAITATKLIERIKAVLGSSTAGV